MRSLRAWWLAPWFLLLPMCGGKSGLYIDGAAGKAGATGSGARGGAAGFAGSPSSGGRGGSKAGSGGGHLGGGAGAGSGGAGGSGTGGSGGNAEPICGNGVVELGESCDDGNQNAGDGCKACVGIVELAAGEAHTCARLSDGTVRCWGGNEFGTLGLGDTEARADQAAELGDALPEVELGADTPLSLTARGWHTCAVLIGGFAKCWGNNADGRLGLGDNMNHGDDPNEMGANLPLLDLGLNGGVISLAAGSYHTCALLQFGKLKCWGNAELGQLGLGSIDHRGDQPGEMGDALQPVDLDALVVAVSAGLYHNCAVLEQGNVKCWGNNGSGQLGLGDTNYRGVFPNEMGENLLPLDLDGVAVAVTTGHYHSCALLEGGSVKCWGGNFCGQLGLGDNEDRGDELNEMGPALPVVDLDGSAVAVSAGATHTCALLDDGRVKCWGCNDSGRLGLGDVLHRGDGPGEMGATLPAVDLGPNRTARALVAGGGHSCALLDNGLAKCWGGNNLGQLGLGDTAHRGDGPNEMGSELPNVLVP